MGKPNMVGPLGMAPLAGWASSRVMTVSNSTAAGGLAGKGVSRIGCAQVAARRSGGL